MRKLSVVLSLLSLCNGAFAVTAAEAQADGMNAGTATSNTAASGLNAAGAQTNVPGYSASDQSGMSSNYGGNSLNVLGVGRNTQCDQAGFVNNGSMANQECNASVTLRRNTNFSTLTPDQIPQPSSSVSVSSILGATTSSKVCRSPGQAGNAVTDMQTCNEALVTYESNCTKKQTPSLSLAADGFTQNPGYSVGEWSARTFSYEVNVNGIPNRVTLNSYQVDNYGQIWINGSLVIQNVLGGMNDMRNGWVGYRTERTCSYDGDTGSEYCYDYQSGPYFFNADGSYTGFYDDGCNWGCRGSSPNLDITKYFRPGSNTIVLTCANAAAIGPCAFNMSMESNVVSPSNWIDGCLPQKAIP